MSYELYVERHAEKDLNKLSRTLFSQITAKIKELPSNPHPRESRKIKGSTKDWRLRIGDYRVLYEIAGPSEGGLKAGKLTFCGVQFFGGRSEPLSIRQSSHLFFETKPYE